MIHKELEFNEEEIISSLKDAGIEVFSSEDAQFNDYSKIQEQMDRIETRLHTIDALFRVASELDAREFSNNCVVPELQTLSWNELCDQGIALLQELKSGWKEIKE